MLIDEQQECGSLPINNTVNYNSGNNSENMLIHNINRAVIYNVCPDPARRQQCITAPTVSHNTVITTGITASGCDLHSCGHVCICEKYPNCLWEDYNIFLSSHIDQHAERGSDTIPSVVKQQNNRIYENNFLYLQVMCWRNYSCLQCFSPRPLLFCLLRVSITPSNWFSRLMMGKYWVFSPQK